MVQVQSSICHKGLICSLSGSGQWRELWFLTENCEDKKWSYLPLEWKGHKQCSHNRRKAVLKQYDFKSDNCSRGNVRNR